MSTYDYFENDGAIFRRVPADGGGHPGWPVRDVWVPGVGWRLYTGDRAKPVCFGNRITEQQAFQIIGAGK